MPKTIKEIKQFIRGTVTHPSESDIDQESASNSLNINPNSRDGFLGGINEDAEDIELLSNQGSNFVDVQAQPAITATNTLSISNMFAVDISSVRSGKTDHMLRGYITNSGTADITGEADELKGNVLFLVSNAKITWITASNAINGTVNPYNHFVGITSHLDSNPTDATQGGGIDVNWWKGIWEAKYPVEWTAAQGDPDDALFGSKGNYLQFADGDGWLTGSIIKNGGGHTIGDTGAGTGTPEGTYYAMPIMLIYPDGTPKNTVSIKHGSSEHFALNCYQTIASDNTEAGTPSIGWGSYDDLDGETVIGSQQPGGQEWGFGIYQPYVSINDWSGLDAVGQLKDKSGQANRILVDKGNTKIHYHKGLEGTTYQDTQGLGTKYPTTAQIDTFDLPQGASTISSSSLVKNNKELHIGTGNTSTNDTLWTGYTILPQFGTDYTDPVVENARLVGADSIPAMHKIVEDDEYVYGIAWYGLGTDDGGEASTNRGTPTDNTRIYKFKKNNNSYGTVNDAVEDITKGSLTLDSLSDAQFTRITAIALAYPGLANKNNYRKSRYNNGSDSFLWVYDSDNGDRGTVYLVNRSTMSVEKTYPIMEEFDFDDNDTDYFTDMHEIFLGTGGGASSGTAGIGASNVNFETLLYASVPCTSRTYSDGDGAPDDSWDKETTLNEILGSTVGDGIITLASTSGMYAATPSTPQLVMIGSEYVSYTGISSNDLTGCTRGVTVLSDGQTLTHSDLAATTHNVGEKVIQGNWNQFPDWKYCFLLVPRANTVTEDIQDGAESANRALFKKDFTTNWYDKQQLRPLSVNLINPGNGKYWPVGYNTSLKDRATTYGGVRLISNMKGFQPPKSVAAIQNRGGFIDTDFVYSSTDTSFHPKVGSIEGFTVAGNDVNDKRAAGWKAVGQWATYDDEAAAATTFTKTYTGTNGTYDASDLTIAEVSTGACRRDMDIRIFAVDRDGTRNGYYIQISTYSNVSNHTGSTMHSTDPTLWPKQQADKFEDVFSLSEEAAGNESAGDGGKLVDGHWVYLIANTSDKYFGIKKSTIPNVTNADGYPNRKKSDSTATAWEGLKFSFAETAFSDDSGTVEWFVTVRTGAASLDYSPSYIKVSVPRLPFGTVAGNSQQVFDRSTDTATKDSFFPAGYSNQKEDFTFNMLVEPGEVIPGPGYTGLIIPEHETADGVTDNRMAALSNIPFYELPATGTWTTIYQSAQSSYAHSLWDESYLNGNKMGCNRYFNPQAISITQSNQPLENANFQTGDGENAFLTQNQLPSPSALVSFGFNQATTGAGYIPGQTPNTDRYLLDQGLATSKYTDPDGGNRYKYKAKAYLLDQNDAGFTVSQWVRVNDLATFNATYDASGHPGTIAAGACTLFEIEDTAGTSYVSLFAGMVKDAADTRQDYAKLYTRFRKTDGSFHMIDWTADDDSANNGDCLIPLDYTAYNADKEHQFMHIVLRHDLADDRWYLYLNSRAYYVDTAQALDNIPNYASTTKAIPGTGVMYFGGANTNGISVIAEFAFWNLELTSADIVKIYNNHIPTNLRLAASYDSSTPDPWDYLQVYFQFGRDLEYTAAGKGRTDKESLFRNDSSGRGNRLNVVNGVETSLIPWPDDDSYPGIRDLKNYGTLEGWASPCTKNNIYFWGEAMLGDLQATPNSVALKLLNPPVCFTYTSNFNTFTPTNTEVLFQTSTGANYQQHWDVPDDGKVYNGSVVFYLGDSGLVESKLNITGMSGAPYNQDSGGFKGASHPDLSVPLHTSITNLGRAVTNYNNKYRSYTWPIIYNVGNADSKLWHAGSNYVYPHANILSSTNLTSADGNAPFASNIHLNLSRKNEGPCDETTSETNRIKLSTEYKPTHFWDNTVHYSTRINDGRYLAHEAASGYHYTDHAAFDSTILSATMWTKPYNPGYNNSGTLMAKTDDVTADLTTTLKDTQLDFDGVNDFIDLGTEFDIAGTVSIGFWMNLDTVGNNEIFSKDSNSPSVQHSFRVYTKSAGVLVVKFFESASATLPIVVWQSNAAITGSAWKHYLITFNNDETIIVYENGSVLAGTISFANTEFIFTNLIAEGDTQVRTFKLPLLEGGTYNFVVDWGDGTTPDTITTWNAAAKAHVYAVGGAYTVTIEGQIVGWSYGDVVGAHYPQKFRAIKEFGPLELTGGGGFSECSYLSIESGAGYPTFGTDLSMTFAHCTHGLTDLGGSVWPVTSVTNMYAMFYNCVLFNDSNIDDWRPESITNMSYMFYGCTVFNQNLRLWSVPGSCTNTSWMFYDCTVFNQGEASGASTGGSFGIWNLANVTTMKNMFYGCAAFNTLTGFYTTDCTNMESMFEGCTVFNRSLGPAHSMTTADVTTFVNMFKGCAAFDQDISHFSIESIAAAGGMDGFLNGGELSSANYNDLLIALAAEVVADDPNLDSITPDFGNSEATGDGITARNTLIAHSWTITDGT